MTTKTVVLLKMRRQGGDRRLVLSQCGEYLVIDQERGEILNIRVFDSGELDQAVAAFRAEGEGHDQIFKTCGGYNPAHSAYVRAVSGHALEL